MAEEMEAVVENENDFQSAFTDAIGEARGEAQPESPEAPETPEAPEVPDAQTETPDPEPNPLGDLISAAQELGLSTDGIDDPAELATLAFEQLRRAQPMVSFAQQVSPYADQIRELIDGKKQPVSEPSQEPQPEPDQWDTAKYLNEKYGGPTWKPEYQRAIESGAVQRDPEKGLWTATPGYEFVVGNILNEMNAAQQHQASFWQRLSQGNPYEQFFEVLREPLIREVENKVKEIVSSRESETKQQSVVERFESDNAAWMYQKNPQSGRNELTADGESFVTAIAELRESGIQDPERLIQYAQKITGLGAGTSQVTTQAAPSGSQNSQGTDTSADQEAQQQSFLERARERAGHSPSARGRQNEDAPQVTTTGDLESMFIRAAKQASTN